MKSYHMTDESVPDAKRALIISDSRKSEKVNLWDYLSNLVVKNGKLENNLSNAADVVFKSKNPKRYI